MNSHTVLVRYIFDNGGTNYVPYKIFPILQATDLSEASEESVEKQLRNVNTSLKSLVYVYNKLVFLMFFAEDIEDQNQRVLNDL
jgi:hypothetical protein